MQTGWCATCHDPIVKDDDEHWWHICSDELDAPLSAITDYEYEQERDHEAIPVVNPPGVVVEKLEEWTMREFAVDGGPWGRRRRLGPGLGFPLTPIGFVRTAELVMGQSSQVLSGDDLNRIVRSALLLAEKALTDGDPLRDQIRHLSTQVFTRYEHIEGDE